MIADAFLDAAALREGRPWMPLFRLVRAIAILLLVTVAAGTSVLFPTTAEAAQQSSDPIPSRDPDDPWLIQDKARLFDEDQMNRFQFDLRRLQGLGREVVVYTRRSDASAEESQEFADTLRDAWKVESAPEADDGMVILINVSDASPLGDAFVVSDGRNVFPLNQLSEAEFQTVREQEVLPPFQEGRYNVALAYAVRRLLHAAEYTPSEPPPLNATQSFANRVASIGGPVLLQAAVLGLVAVPAFSERRLTVRPSRRTVLNYVLVFGSAIALLLLFSVVGRSGWGMATALITLGLVTIVSGVFLRGSTAAGAKSRPVRVRATGRHGQNRVSAGMARQRERYVPQS